MAPVIDSTQAVELSSPLVEGKAAGKASVTAAASRRSRKPRCEDCFFHQNGLCALPEKKPCPTFRPAHPDGLRPPKQLSFVFRQERRSEPFLFQPAGA
jgi:hypothetical protein